MADRTGGARIGLVVVLLLALTPGAGRAAEPLPLRDGVAGTPRPRPAVQVYGSGFGHGVGMSQYGARYLAGQGWSAGRILGHYYPGTGLVGRDTSRRIRVAVWTNRAGGDDIKAPHEPLRWAACPGGEPGAPMTDGDCGDSAGAAQFTQPAGSVWAVEPYAGGGFDVVVKDGSGSPPDDPDGPDVRAGWIRIYRDGAVMYSTNPNRPGWTKYRWGLRDVVHNGEAGMHVVEDLALERYLRGLAEMPSSWPAAALQAQAITGRTYALRVADPPATGGRWQCACDLRATPTDQAWTAYSKETETVDGTNYGQRWVAVVDATTGRVVTHDGNLAQTFYSSSHGGRSEAVEDSWAYGSTAIPYLRSVDDPYSLRVGGNAFSRWRAAVPNSQLAGLTGSRFDVVTGVQVQDRTAGTTPTVVTVRGRDADGDRLAPLSFDGGDDKHAGAAFRLDLAPHAVFASGRHVEWLTRLPSSQGLRFGLLPFRDDDGGTHEYATLFGERAGIVDGFGDGTYRPRWAVTRAQMAAFMYRTFDIPAGDGTRFSDVGSGHTHERAIGAVADAGIARGYADGTFRPDEPVSRAQMATFVARAAGLPDGDVGQFDDVSEDSAHAGSIGGIADAGITHGCASRRYCPGGAVTRGEMATFVFRTVEHLR